MTDTTNTLADRGFPASPTRSLGLKLMVILFLIVLMAVPVIFISVISFERSSRADEVTREVSQTYGGAQTLLGPVIVVPYQQQLSRGRLQEGDYVISAKTGEAVFDNVTVEEKARSLYRVPVYSADGVMRARFDRLADGLPQQDGLVFDADAAKLVVGLSDVTGLQSDVTLSTGGRTLTFEPYRASAVNFAGRDAQIEYAAEPTRDASLPDVITDPIFARGLTLLSVPLSDVSPGDVEARLSLTGAPSLAVQPYARSTRVRIASDWPHPGFEGRFPPSEREISEDGFSAAWAVPFLRRGIPAAGKARDMNMLFGLEAGMRVNFVTPLDPYQTVNRALKYAVMFIGLVFLAYFLMETLLGVRVHPAQYLLIGLAQAVFYLLLLAFAEQIGFTPAFLLSASATVALTALYAGAVFGRSLVWKSALVFGTVYGLLFVLMRIQDFALMVGALVCFIAIAATLYLTRNLDWYGGRTSLATGDNSPV